MSTLYNQAKYVEEINNTLKTLNVSNQDQIDVTKFHKTLFEKYNTNPIMHDAIHGRQTIGKSIEELGNINKGIKKFLPWKKDKIHNQKLKELGELVSTPFQLYTYGIFNPDNFITAATEVTGLCFGTTYLFCKLIEPSISINTIEAQHLLDYRLAFSSIMSTILAPSLGFFMSSARFRSLPKNEAKYLDEKIEKLFM